MIHVYPDPLDAAIAALDTSNLDVAVSSRAPSSTALSSAMWTDTKAGYLDAAISSVRYPVQTEITRSSALIANLHTLAYEFAAASSALTVSSGGAYTEAVSVNAPGILWWASCHRGSGFSAGTLNIRITLDGVVALLTNNSSTATTLGSGVVGVGYVSGGSAFLMPLRFTTSMKIEVTSSVTQTGGNDIESHYLYTLD